MTPAQEQMALDAVRGTLNLHPEPNALGAARIRIHSSDGGVENRATLDNSFKRQERVAGLLRSATVQRRVSPSGPSDPSARARAARVFAFAVYAGFGIPTATFLIILAHLIDWIGVAESVGLY